MKCPHCKKENEEDTNFCIYCGKTVMIKKEHKPDTQKAERIISKPYLVLGVILIAIITIVAMTVTYYSDDGKDKVISPSIIPTCNKPYILVGTNCCLDQNDNKICDKDEIVKSEIKTTTLTPTVSVPVTKEPELKELKVNNTEIKKPKAESTSVSLGPKIKVTLTDVLGNKLSEDFTINGTDNFNYVYHLENLEKNKLRCSVDEEVNGALNIDHQVLILDPFERNEFPEGINKKESINYTVKYMTRCRFEGKLDETVDIKTFITEFK